MTSAANQLVYDAAAFAGRERFGAYHDLYASGADVTAAGAAFGARMTGARLDRALIYDRRLRGVAHRRDAGRVRRDALEHLTLTLLVGGEFHADAGDGFRRLMPGEVVLLDMTRPMRNRAVDAHVVTMSLARDRVTDLVGDPRRLHGRVLSAGAAALLADHLASLARHAAQLDPAALMPVSRAGIDLLGAALAGEARVRPGRHAAARVDCVCALVEERLFEPGFGAEAVLERFAVSRATLYRDFQPWGGLGAYIRRRRLEVLGERLADPGEARSLAELAHQLGFSTEARQSEAFLTHFGMRPGAYRRTVREEQAAARSARRMREWQNVLR
ncbi:MAG TPA: AraC family transcriptional regulator [Sphingomonas sp.]|nr:AraC family transcriptional regulator [Sphingomonas sp.]